MASRCAIFSMSQLLCNKTPVKPFFRILLNNSLSQVKIIRFCSAAIFSTASSWMDAVYDVSKPKMRNFRATLPNIASAKNDGLLLCGCLTSTLLTSEGALIVLQKVRPFPALIAVSRDITSRAANLSSNNRRLF